MPVKKTSHSRFELWYHFAWGTKYRKHIFRDFEMREYTKKLFREIAMHYDMEIGAIEVMSDHLHCMVSAPPRIAPSQVVQILKSISTKRLFERYQWLHGQYWGGEIWIAGYFVRSVGKGVTIETIKR